jgi:(2Fe-2S) ferredoxin
MSDSPRFPVGAKIAPEEISRAKRHLFLCAGPDCCDPSEGEALWNVLKAETRTLAVPTFRTKAACLRICKEGPWLVVYPDGIWYGKLDAEKLRHILREHVEEGRPVREWIAIEMPNLAGGARGPKLDESPAPAPPVD